MDTIKIAVLVLCGASLAFSLLSVWFAAKAIWHAQRAKELLNVAKTKES